MSNEREVRKETDFWGNEKEVIYENDRKVGEIKAEERGGFFGIGGETVKVEYDTDGRESSYTKQEERGGLLGLGAEQVEVRYDVSDKEIAHSRVEERGGFLGIGAHHVRVEYDNTQNEVSQSNTERRGDFLGIGGERVRVTRYSPASTTTTHDGSSYSSASNSSESSKSSISSTSSSSGNGGGIALVILLAVVLILAALPSRKNSEPQSAPAATAIRQTPNVTRVDQIRRLKTLGQFSNYRFTGEHQYGAAVELWEEGNAVFGLFSFSEGLAGDTPTGMLESVFFERATGKLSFIAKLTMGQHICDVHSIYDNVPSRDQFSFEGIVSNSSISGTLKHADGLHLDRDPKEENLLLKKQDEANSIQFESRGHWETAMQDVLKFRGPKW